MASRARKMAARAIRKIHVPAYCPADFGVHATENRGVVEDAKNAMAMELIPIMSELEDDMSMELVELAMDIPVVVADAALDMDMVPISIDMMAFQKSSCAEK